MIIKDKIEEIENYLFELAEIVPENFERYKTNLEKKAACERYFEKIIEASTDLAFLIIKDKNLKVPEDDKQAFDILAEEKIISRELAERLKDAKGMRNFLIHQYEKIDDNLVFCAVSEELEKDIKEFLDIKKKFATTP